MKRPELLRWIAGRIPEPVGEDCVRVGIDGVDGSGKTVFADALAAVLREVGRPVVRVGVDDFHNVRAIRYRRGRTSAEGFWLDAFNYERLLADVLVPLGPGGSRRYRPVAHDLASDSILNPGYELAPPGAVVVVDGLFLHRDELAWDYSIFLDAPFEVTVQRMVDRDGVDAGDLRRYVDAQLLYFAECDPQRRADVVIDNTLLDAPHVRAARSTGSS